MIYRSLGDSDQVHGMVLLPLVGTNNARVHAGEMVVDVVLLGVGVALCTYQSTPTEQDVGEPTGASIHCRSLCSSCAQPWAAAVCPDDAQHPAVG